MSRRDLPAVSREVEGSLSVAAVEQQLAALTRRVDALEQRDRARRVLTRADQARLETLLPAIAGAMGSAWWTVHEVTALAVVQLVLDGLNVHQLGRLLRRAEASEQPIAGLVVERGGTEARRVQWRIVATLDEFSTP